MNKVHSALVTYLRNAMDQNDSGASSPMTKVLKSKSDEQIVRMMFMNFRGRENSTRGLRLTNLGLQIMLGYFRAYDVEASDTGAPKDLTPEQLLYLDRKAKLPYHVSETGHIIVFDQELGIKLMLADGDIDVLVEMDDMSLKSHKA